MIRIFLSSLVLVLAMPCFGQTMNCSDAAYRLQSYASQVNAIYQQEYWNVIPNTRCPAVVADQWGRPVGVHPELVQNCRWQMLANLNQWYGAQCQYINSWYVQIVRGCSTDRSSRVGQPAPDPIDDDSENIEIDTDEIEELTAGIDEEKALKITIPRTAAGFKPRN
jgi:hypothetical protein